MGLIKDSASFWFAAKSELRFGCSVLGYPSGGPIYSDILTYYWVAEAPRPLGF